MSDLRDEFANVLLFDEDKRPRHTVALGFDANLNSDDNTSQTNTATTPSVTITRTPESAAASDDNTSTATTSPRDNDVSRQDAPVRNKSISALQLSASALSKKDSWQPSLALGPMLHHVHCVVQSFTSHQNICFSDSLDFC